MRFRLRRERNAISEFAAVLQFFRPVSQAAFQEVTSALQSMRTELNLPAPMHVQYIALNQGGVAPPPPMMGMGFQRFAADGEIAASLLCEAQSITYVMRDYTSWLDVKPQLLDVFTRLGGVYIKQVPAIHSVRLQYANEFFARDPEIKDALELFKPANPWITRRAESQAEAWHVHSGYFSPVSSDQRELTNVNFDFNLIKTADMPAAMFRMTATLLAGIFHDVPGKPPLTVDAAGLNAIVSDYLERSHTLEKSLLREIFAEQYLQAMGDDS